MSTLALQDAEVPVVADDLIALEQRVLRTVELLRNERTARAKAEEEMAAMRQLMDEQSVQLTEVQTQLRTLESEREGVRQRVERLLQQLDEINA
uniref:Cell division protein ZapB n=1 Tax=Acidobacterium capsulatum TaxID=33075 RepID=A0A7V4XR04_9BACT